MSELRALVVCTGNTCRSPMGEAILRERLTSGRYRRSGRIGGDVGVVAAPG